MTWLRTATGQSKDLFSAARSQGAVRSMDALSISASPACLHGRVSNTQVWVLWESLKKRVRSLSPCERSRHSAFSKCLKPQTNSPLCTQFSHTVLGCIPSPRTSWHRHQVAIGTHFHQDRLTDENDAVWLHRPYTCTRTSPSQQKAPAADPTALVCSNAAALALAALSARVQRWDFLREKNCR